MRRFAIAFVTAVSMISLTQIASATPYNWTGFYVGGNVGGGWGTRDLNYTANDPATAILLNPVSGGMPTVTSFRSSGVLGGFQLGYNWQLAPTWLVGLETDFDWSGMKGGGSSSGLFVTIRSYTTAVDEHTKWFGTVRARLGYLPAPNLLAFVTGGFAYGRVDHSGTYNTVSGFSIPIDPKRLGCQPNSPCLSGLSSGVATGWTLGGGLEFAVTRNWTLKAEYLYVSLSDKSLTEMATNGGGSSFNVNYSRTNFNVARVGVNYRF